MYVYKQYSSNSVIIKIECSVSNLGLSPPCFAVGTEEKISGACRLCDSIQLSIHLQKCLHFLELRRLNRNDHIT